MPFALIYGNVQLVVYNPFNRKNPIQTLQRLIFAIINVGRCSHFFSFALLLVACLLGCFASLLLRRFLVNVVVIVVVVEKCCPIMV